MPQTQVHSGQPFSVTEGIPPHAGQPIRSIGRTGMEATYLLILVHGRGATAEDILTLGPHIASSEWTMIAPQASGGVWYPFSFLSPSQANEPGLSSAIEVLEGIVRQAEHRGISSDRIAIAGFSQGACLALEFAVRHPRHYAAIAGFSGGLIGPPGTTWTPSGTLNGTPVFLGCSDRDPHIPESRVRESADIFMHLQAQVDIRLYKDMGHTINEHELSTVGSILAARHSGAQG